MEQFLGSIIEAYMWSVESHNSMCLSHDLKNILLVGTMVVTDQAHSLLYEIGNSTPRYGHPNPSADVKSLVHVRRYRIVTGLGCQVLYAIGLV